jgi:hypothetical protein
LETVERTAAITGIIDTLDAEWILDACLGQSRERYSKNTSGKQNQNDNAHRLLLRPYAEKLRPTTFSVYAETETIFRHQHSLTGLTLGVVSAILLKVCS